MTLKRPKSLRPLREVRIREAEIVLLENVPGSNAFVLASLRLFLYAYLYRKSEVSMNEETFNLSIRKFLKMVGVNSQRAIEQAVDKAVADGAIAGTESFPATVTLEVAGLQLSVKFDGEIKLQ